MIKNVRKAAHPFHQVEVSPWPFLMSITIFTGAIGVVSWLGDYPTNPQTFAPSLLLISIQWWRDVVREAKGGFHTTTVQRGILIGFMLFLLSEIMLFSSMFWAFFHSSLAPAVELGCEWPPIGISSIDPWSLAQVGTCVLLASGFVLTWGHHALILGDKSSALIGLFLTVLLGGLFLVLQYTEYTYAEYSISDSVFGCTFYMLTGLHGLHVIVGVIFLAVGMVRIYMDHFTTEHHIGLEFAIYYWHLVDVVWLVVFVLVYWWGGAN